MRMRMRLGEEMILASVGRLEFRYVTGQEEVRAETRIERYLILVQGEHHDVPATQMRYLTNNASWYDITPGRTP